MPAAASTDAVSALHKSITITIWLSACIVKQSLQIDCDDERGLDCLLLAELKYGVKIHALSQKFFPSFKRMNTAPSLSEFPVHKASAIHYDIHTIMQCAGNS